MSEGKGDSGKPKELFLVEAKGLFYVLAKNLRDAEREVFDALEVGDLEFDVSNVREELARAPNFYFSEHAHEEPLNSEDGKTVGEHIAEIKLALKASLGQEPRPPKPEKSAP